MATGVLCLQEINRCREEICPDREGIIGLTWAYEKFYYYLHVIGTTFEKETDHKLLVKPLGQSHLANLFLCCQRPTEVEVQSLYFSHFKASMLIANLRSQPVEILKIRKEKELRGWKYT